MAVHSVATIDIDLVTLPQSNLTEIDVTDNSEPQIPTTKQRQASTTEKWDWNADFIPLQWDGVITISSPLSADNYNDSPSETSEVSKPSLLKHITQIYRDDKTMPPWISNSYPHHNFIDRLHMELVDFCMFISPKQEEHSIRVHLIERIKHIVLHLWPRSTIHVFGSMKTKLYLPTSDIDLAIYPNRNTNNSNGDCKLQLAQALKKANMCTYLEIIATARVPLVKFTDAESNISVDIVFDRESGIIAADEMNSLQSKYPVLRPLTYFLKYFLWFRNLNEPFRGGMGSYLLQMLIVNLIQSHPIRATRRWRSVDSEISLGGWLMAFFELYGKTFNYSELGISPYPNAHYFIKEDNGMKIYDRPHLLCCQCPFESTASKIMDSGRNTYNIMKIKLAFEWAHNTLLSSNCNGRNARKSILGLLVGIRGEILHYRSRSNEEQLIKCKTQKQKQKQFEMNNLLIKTFDFENMDNMDNWSTISSSDANGESDNGSFIPFDDSTSSCTTTTSSSSSYVTYNDDGDIESDEAECIRYHPSEFQQKHLFNVNVLSNITKQNKDDDDDMDNIKFSFEKEMDIENNPYLNQKYNPFPKRKKKRSFGRMNEDNDQLKTQSKKRKTMSLSDLNDTNDNSLCRSFSMPDLRKKTPCIFYKKGECKKGDLCPFQHGDDDKRRNAVEATDALIGSNQICWNFASGHCYRGSKCRWLHASQPTEST